MLLRNAASNPMSDFLKNGLKSSARLEGPFHGDVCDQNLRIFHF